MYAFLFQYEKKGTIQNELLCITVIVSSSRIGSLVKRVP